MDPVIVIGAGIAGISCARALADAGVAVLVLERDRRPGGRMASPECAGRPVDTGASYFTVSDDRFDEVVRDWQRRGLARPWADTFDVYADGAYADRASRGGSGGPLRWAAVAGLQTLVRDLADGAGLRVEQCEVEQVSPADRAVDGRSVDSRSVGSRSVGSRLAVDGRPAAAVVLAMPDPQARAILHPDLAAERAGLYARFEPVLALSAGWPRRDWRRLDGVFVNGDERLSWIADDGSRRGDGAPVLVAHSTPSWAARQLGQLDQPEQPNTPNQPNQPAEAAGQLLQALSEVLGITTAPSWTRLDQWLHAKPAAGRPAGFQLWPSLVGACGDGWSPRPRVEAAFLSGLGLGNALAARLR
ncbi:MAG: FAD-dependent oxidoreductase [Jatrophihabitantaceae bacterium]